MHNQEKYINNMTEKNRKAVILLSGGLDSTTVLAHAKKAGYRCYCLSFLYGQKQSIELQMARYNAKKYQAEEHLVLDLGLDKIGGSALTDNIVVPKRRVLGRKEQSDENSSIPVTYVPGRNTIFLSYAIAWAEVVGAWDIFIGVNAMDYSGYPDCRPEYLASVENMAKLATKASVEGRQSFVIHAPLMQLTKKEIVLKGLELGVDHQNTHSCYDPEVDGAACGLCDACQLRLKGFAEAGHVDPLAYKVE